MGLSLRKLFKAREKPGEDVQRVSTVEITDQQVRDAVRDIPHMYMWMIQKRIRRFRTTVEHGTWASTTAVGCSVLSTTEIQ